MNAKTSMFVICVEVIIYLLLYNLNDNTFKAFNQINGKQQRILKNFFECRRFYFVPN